VTVYFKNRDVASREVLVQEVRDYVDRPVETCDDAICFAGFRHGFDERSAVE